MAGQFIGNIEESRGIGADKQGHRQHQKRQQAGQIKSRRYRLVSPGYVPRFLISRDKPHHRIPDTFDYDNITGMRREAQEKLSYFRPATVGQASRISGVNPADISILLVYLARPSTGRREH